MCADPARGRKLSGRGKGCHRYTWRRRAEGGALASTPYAPRPGQVTSSVILKALCSSGFHGPPGSESPVSPARPQGWWGAAARGASAGVNKELMRQHLAGNEALQ